MNLRPIGYNEELSEDPEQSDEVTLNPGAYERDISLLRNYLYALNQVKQECASNPSFNTGCSRVDQDIEHVEREIQRLQTAVDVDEGTTRPDLSFVTEYNPSLNNYFPGEAEEMIEITRNTLTVVRSCQVLSIDKGYGDDDNPDLVTRLIVRFVDNPEAENPIIEAYKINFNYYTTNEDEGYSSETPYTPPEVRDRITNELENARTEPLTVGYKIEGPDMSDL